jgi:hypothetical protein
VVARQQWRVADSQADSAQAISFFAETYLWADDDWLTPDPEGLCYRFWRLPIHMSAQPAHDQFKWRIRIEVVQGVTDQATAESLCLHLNKFAIGMSLAYDKESQAVVGLIAAVAPVEWDRLLTLTAECVKLSAWFCESIAEAMAEALGGTPAFDLGTAPHRDDPDVNIHYLNAMRERPEWVFDGTYYMFPKMLEVAEHFARPMGVVVPMVVEGQIELSGFSPGGSPIVMEAGFARDNLGGECWSSTLVVERINPALAGALTWWMYETDHATLMGAWRLRGDSLAFTSNILTGSLRTLEQRRSFAGHTAEELWMCSSTLVSAAQARDAVDPTAVVPEFIDTAELADQCLAPITKALNNLSDGTAIDREPSGDPAVLWFDREEVLLLMGWFNPVGPTLETYVIAENAHTARTYLVRFMRHPMMPEYHVIAELDEDSDVVELLRRELASNLFSLPMFLSTHLAPEHLRDPLVQAVRECVLQFCEEQSDMDLVWEAQVVASSLGDPWASTRPAHQDISAIEVDMTGGPFETWLRQVSDSSHVLANLMHLPDAWDGSINLLSSASGQSRPMKMVYNMQIGVIDPSRSA